jgi:hypothetical protein
MTDCIQHGSVCRCVHTMPYNGVTLFNQREVSTALLILDI